MAQPLIHTAETIQNTLLRDIRGTDGWQAAPCSRSAAQSLLAATQPQTKLPSRSHTTQIRYKATRWFEVAPNTVNRWSCNSGSFSDGFRVQSRFGQLCAEKAVEISQVSEIKYRVSLKVSATILHVDGVGTDLQHKNSS